MCDGEASGPATSCSSAATNASRDSAGTDASSSACSCSTIRPPAATAAAPFGVTRTMRARRSSGAGHRSARPAFSSSSSVTTIVVLSSIDASARRIWVSSSSSAFDSTQYLRGDSSTSASRDAMSFVRANVAWFRRNRRSMDRYVSRSSRCGTIRCRTKCRDLLDRHLLPAVIQEGGVMVLVPNSQGADVHALHLLAHHRVPQHARVAVPAHGVPGQGGHTALRHDARRHELSQRRDLTGGGVDEERAYAFPGYGGRLGAVARRAADLRRRPAPPR